MKYYGCIVNINIGKAIRLSDFIDSVDGRSLIVDTTITSSLGATPGLEDLTEVIKNTSYNFDGIIINPGQAEHQAEHYGGKERAAPIIRVDWTNAYRDENFCLPASNVKRLMISNSEDAFQLGASSVIASFLLGFEDDFEAENIQDLSRLARACHPISLPIIVDIHPIGPGVSKNNYEESIKLGVSFMQELGADVLIIPDCNRDTCKKIADWLSIPVLLRLNKIPPKEKTRTILKSGIAGIVLSEAVFTDIDFDGKVITLKSMIHERGRKNVVVSR